MKTFFEKYKKIASFSHWFSSIFITFSASIFASIFSSIFDGKWLPKTSGGIPVRAPFWRPFRDLFRRSTFWCILVVLWLTFGSLLAPLGRLLASFGSLLVPFGSLLDHFWCPLVHFWCPWAHFRSPWRSIFSLLGSHGVIFDIFWIFRWKSYVKSYFFRKCSLKFRLFFFLFLRHFQQSTRRQYQAPWPSHPTVFKGPERNLAAGNLD